MKKFYVIVSLLAIMLGTCCACAKEDIPSGMGDFSLDLPEGYSVIERSEDSCSFVYDRDNSTVGGVEITQMRKRDLSDEGTTNIMVYLQEEFHETNNIEFIAVVGGGENPHVGVTLTKIDDTTGEKWHFYHVFFERDSCIYHAWFDEDVIDQKVEDHIISLLIEK